MLDLDASNGHAWHTMGQMEEKQGKLDAALACYSAGQQGSGERLRITPSLRCHHPSPLLRRTAAALETALCVRRLKSDNLGASLLHICSEAAAPHDIA